MQTKKEGSSAQLFQFSAWYFALYVVFTVATKYFIDRRPGYPGVSGMEFLYHSTLGGMGICLTVVLVTRWWRRLESRSRVTFLGCSFPREFLWIAPSGLCTAVVIPTTTMMYTFPITIMIAMTLMRASVIVIGRVVDAIQIRQGILKKRVPWEENLAALFAFSTVLVVVSFAPPGGFNFLSSVPALITMGLYIGSYAVRIYIMNHFKNTQGKGDSKAFFAIEEIFAVVFVVLITGFFLASPALFGWQDKRILAISSAAAHPHAGAMLAGVPFGIAAFFSVFLFMFKGRTGTFTVLVNRVASLLAGTAATLLYHFGFGGRLPDEHEWISLALVGVAIGLLVKAERRRAQETVSLHVVTAAVTVSPPAI